MRLHALSARPCAASVAVPRFPALRVPGELVVRQVPALRVARQPRSREPCPSRGARPQHIQECVAAESGGGGGVRAPRGRGHGQSASVSPRLARRKVTRVVRAHRAVCRPRFPRPEVIESAVSCAGENLPEPTIFVPDAGLKYSSVETVKMRPSRAHSGGARPGALLLSFHVSHYCIFLFSVHGPPRVLSSRS